MPHIHDFGTTKVGTTESAPAVIEKTEDFSAQHFRKRVPRRSLTDYEFACARILDGWHGVSERSEAGSNCVSPAKKKARNERDETDRDHQSTTSETSLAAETTTPPASPSSSSVASVSGDDSPDTASSVVLNTKSIEENFLEMFATESILDDAFFVGHVNTDADSVCGAIAAAYLFNGTPLISEPASSLNGEITFALEEAGVPVPVAFADIEDIASKKICLVDHSEKKQMVPYLRENINQVVGVIDHHALASSFYTEKPIYMDIRPWGCMCTILTHSFIRMGKKIPQHIAKLMLSAVLSDTLNLKSPTTTKADKFAICLLSAAAGVTDVDAQAARQFEAKTKWACSLGAKAMTRADCKEFEAHGKKLVIGVLEIAGSPAPLLKHKEDVVKELEILRGEKNVDYAFFFVVDVVTQTSVMIFPGDAEDKITDIAFKLDISGKSNTEPNLKSVGNYASRKKEFFPMIQTGLKEFLASN